SNATTAGTPYPAPQSQGQQSPTLIVVTHVNNAGVGTANAANFSQVITNAFSNPDGYTYAYHFVRGSQMGVSLNLQPGIFTVSAFSNNKTNSLFLNQSYDTTYSGDCNTVKSTTSTGSIYGYGTINPGEGKTCMVTKLFHKK
ncbi:MAG: hypothetical protein M3044_16585, partial [Thermoproteota archaeon]|nr:hypothetical protein [Thermoproteota archaeon]